MDCFGVEVDGETLRKKAVQRRKGSKQWHNGVGFEPVARTPWKGPGTCPWLVECLWNRRWKGRLAPFTCVPVALANGLEEPSKCSATLGAQ